MSWNYSLDDVSVGVQHDYATLVVDAERRHGVGPTTFAAIGVFAMMHCYLAFDRDGGGDGEWLGPFRTWRNTYTGSAAAELTTEFAVNVPSRLRITHLHQAVLDDELHLAQVRFITTLAGFSIHLGLTGAWVLGVAVAYGMFSIDDATPGYEPELLDRYDRRVDDRLPWQLAELLPEVLPAGRAAGD